MQYVPLHVLSSKSCISTPEICAHVGVCMSRSVGTSAPKKIIQVVPSEYVRFTPFRRSYYGLFPELVLERLFRLPALQNARK